jgi:hypothetical protein
MKIIKKPKILLCTCEVCKCEFLPKQKELFALIRPTVKDTVRCPFCGCYNEVQFEVDE